MSSGQHFDVCVLGSGFAGSLIAIVLAKSGMSVAVIDKGRHPRFTIGESSTPAADYLLHELAVKYSIDELLPLCQYGSWKANYPNVRCGCKRGFSYVWHGSGNEYQATSNHRCELMVSANANECVADTQWYRPDIDHLIYNLAIKYGAVTFESAQSMEFSSETESHNTGWQVDFTQYDTRLTIAADFVVDASGPSSSFVSHVGSKDRTDSLLTNTSATYSHFTHCNLTESWLSSQSANKLDWPYRFDQAAVHHLFHGGWLWQIDFECNLTSLGFVGHYPTQHRAPTKATAGDVWSRILLKYPVIADLLQGSQLAELPGDLLHHSRIQRLNSLASGKAWVALPFTVGFIDPLHSTGIAHSLTGVLRICQALLAKSASERDSLICSYSQDVLSELQHIDALIFGCYQALADFRLFTAWTMFYFAAATIFESQHRSGHQPSFLLANRLDFSTALELAAKDLALLIKGGKLTDQIIDQHCQLVRELLIPFNHVGLFAPPTPNMYWHTAAVK